MIESRYRGSLPESPPWVQSYLESQEWFPLLLGIVQYMAEDATNSDKYTIDVLREIDTFIQFFHIDFLSVDHLSRVLMVDIESTPEITMFILKHINSA